MVRLVIFFVFCWVDYTLTATASADMLHEELNDAVAIGNDVEIARLEREILREAGIRHTTAFQSEGENKDHDLMELPEHSSEEEESGEEGGSFRGPLKVHRQLSDDSAASRTGSVGSRGSSRRSSLKGSPEMPLPPKGTQGSFKMTMDRLRLMDFD